MRMRAVLTALCLFVWAGTAWAGTTIVETKFALSVRDEPSPSGRVVEKIGAGKKVQLLGRDGAWSHIQTPNGDGWVPSNQLKGGGGGATAGDDEEPAGEDEALAKRRKVRPEVWVSKSKYHEDENKLTVTASKAELFGRPQTGGAVVGVLKRGEQVKLVRKSTDKRWYLVDIGGGDVAWVEARLMRSGGGGEAPPEEEEPPPPRRRTAERPPEEEEPPPPPKRGKRRDIEAEREAEREQREREQREREQRERERTERTERTERDSRAERERERERDEAAARERQRDREDEAAPVERRKPARRAAAAAPRGGQAVARHRLAIGLGFGFVQLQQRFTSNGTGRLANYEASAGSLGASVGIQYLAAVTNPSKKASALLGVDGGYVFAGGGSVRYKAMPNDILLGLQSHFIEVALNAGVHINASEGIDLRLRLGLGAQLNLIGQNPSLPLPSDLMLGMLLGLGFDWTPYKLRGLPLPIIHIAASLNAPASRSQTGGLEEGARNSSLGFRIGGGLTFGVWKGLGFDLAASYGIALTHFEGSGSPGSPMRGRDLSVTAADRGNSDLQLLVGLSYRLNVGK